MTPPPMLGRSVSPSGEMRALWEGWLRGTSGAPADSADQAVRYGLRVSELDVYRISSLHGFVSPDAAVEWARRERRREASERARPDDPLEEN